MVESNSESVRFKSFIPGGIEIAINYIVSTNDMNEFLGIQESINFQIIEIIKLNNAFFYTPENTGRSEEKKKINFR
jgi:hypothetical protein